MGLQRFLKLVFPYFSVGIACYALVPLRWLCTSNVYRDSFAYRLKHDVARWCQGNQVAAIGVALLAYVFFLWRPQSKWQLLLAFPISTAFLLAPAFSNRYEDPIAYLLQPKYLLDCYIQAWCLLAALVIPFSISWFTKFRIQRHFDLTPNRTGTALWELLFVTMCIAILMALMKRVSMIEQEQHGYMTKSFEKELLASLAITIGTSVSILLLLLYARTASRFQRRLLVIGVATSILAFSYLATSHQHWEWARYFFANSRAMVGLMIPIGLALFIFMQILKRSGYRIGRVVPNHSTAVVSEVDGDSTVCNETLPGKTTI